MSRSDRLEIHVVPHTHWDREWYEPAGRLRQWLVELVDDLLDDAADGSDAPFVLDGQAILLHDYLDVRPEMRDRIASLLAAGELEAGPWYVLADELVPCGEALVRNLLAGARAVRELEAEPAPVLYSPDAFGHPAALPMLAAGFALRVCVVWRGLGGRRWPAGDTFLWSAADGSRVLVHHLPSAGYEFGSSIPANLEAVASWWEGRREILLKRARTSSVLLLNGADHHARQRNLEEALANLAMVERDHTVRRSSLRSFAERLESAASDAHLPEITGELRDSAGHAWSLQGTLGVRARLKRGNAIAERVLVRDAEPWAAMASLRSSSTRRALLRAAWRTLLHCHPHDTLCGCSTDQVARAMQVRLEDVLAQARGIREDAVLDLLGHDRERARERPAEWRPVVVVRNCVARRRRGVASVEMLRFLRDVPVGPGSARGSRGMSQPGNPLLDDGALVQPIRMTERHDRTPSPRHYPDDDLVEAVQAAVWVDEVRGYGLLVLPLDFASGAPPQAALPADVSPVTTDRHGVDNGLARVGLDHRALTVRRSDGSGPVVRIELEDSGDAGDLYTYSGIGARQRTIEYTAASVVERGPLRGTLEVTYELLVPVRSGRGGRDSRKAKVPVKVNASLHAGEPFARLSVTGRNRARDHRLRIVLATGLRGTDALADAAFGTVSRPRAAHPPEPDEHPVATAPMARHVTISRAADSVTMFSDGLAEYEATESGDIALTLVRAVGELSRDDLPERPGHAGWPVPTPQAQEQGRFIARVGVMISAAADPARALAIEHAAEDFLLPLTGGTLRSALTRYADLAGLELEGDGLAFSACKEREEGDGMVLRCVNLLDRPVRGRWRVGVPVGDVWLARVDETPEREIASENGVISFEASPHETVTILVAPTLTGESPAGMPM